MRELKRRRARATGAGSVETSSPARILVVAAHPDDEVLGCGGTMARHAALGESVSLLILGEGITSRGRQRDTRKYREELDGLRRDAARAARVLGVARLFHRQFPDNRFDSVPLLDIIKAVEEVKSEVRPTTIYTHHGGDLNIDHRVVFQAVMTAWRPQPGEALTTIYSFEVSSSTEWQAATADSAFRPTTYVDISRTLPQKLEAMQKYRSELRDFPHPRSLQALDLIARRNGLEVGLEAAERFALVRTVVGP